MRTTRSEYMKTYRQRYKQRVRIVKVSAPNPLFAKLERLAKAEGKRPATMAREMIEAELLGDVRIPVSVRAELSALRVLVRNIASNVNQMAHHSNTVRRVVDEGALFEQLKRLEQGVTDFTKRRLKATDDHQIDAR